MHVVILTTIHWAHRSKSAKHHKLEIQPYILSQESDLYNYVLYMYWLLSFPNPFEQKLQYTTIKSYTYQKVSVSQLVVNPYTVN